MPQPQARIPNAQKMQREFVASRSEAEAIEAVVYYASCNGGCSDTDANFHDRLYLLTGKTLAQICEERR